MNTKAYKLHYKRLLDEGKIPAEFYDNLMAAIAEKGKMTHEIFNKNILEELERYRLFDVPAVPYSDKNSAKTDGTYVYLHRKNPFWYINHAILSTVFKFIGWLGSGLVYGLWHFPRKLAKKFKGVGACFTTSNHVGYVDAVLTRRALGVKKQNIIAAPFNCKNDVGGAILRTATMLPLPSSLGGTHAFLEALEYYKEKGSAMHFYAESCMWARYRKPRPYKKGVYYYAVKLNVPIVPMFYGFKDTKGLRKLLGLAKAKIMVGDPIYPDETLPKLKRQADMAERVERATREMYESFYGVPLEYLSEKEIDAEQADESANVEKLESVEPSENSEASAVTAE